MAAKATAINWQALFNGAMATLEPADACARPARNTPIFQRQKPQSKDTGFSDSVRDRAFSNAATALAELWKIRH